MSIAHLPPAATAEEVGAVLARDGVAVVDGLVPPATMERVGAVNITYNLSWLRQEENQYLSVPLEIARTLPVELLRLIGYARGAYALGYVDDLRDPIEIVRPDLATTGLGDLHQALERARDQRGG